MGGRRWQMSRLVVAVLAAYLLVLQGLIGGVASGRHVATMAIYQSIHRAICNPDSAGTPLPAQDGKGQLPPCCAQGCTLLAMAAGTPAAIALPIAYDISSRIDAGPSGIVLGSPPAHESAGRPRAPPVSLRTT